MDRTGAHDASTRTVVVALTANLSVTVAKSAAALLTGSAAMFAEAVHSLADTTNELFLYVGLRRAERPPDRRHPHAYGREHYFWALLAAVGIFVAGGVAALWEGLGTFLHPRPVEAVPVGLAVLAVSTVFEGWSWLVSRRQLVHDAGGRMADVPGFVDATSDPAPVTVFFEDSAALVGIVIAAVGLTLHALTGQSWYDAAAGATVGLLLVVVAVRLVLLDRRLIVGISAPRSTTDRIRDEVEGHPWVASVPTVRAVLVGPRRLSVSIDVTVHAGLTSEVLVARVAELRDSMRSRDGVVVADVNLVPASPADRGPGTARPGSPAAAGP